MLYREPITPAIIGVALVLTFTTATASEIDSSAKDQKIIVAHHVQSEGHKSAHTKHFKEKSCHHKKGKHGKYRGKKEHKSSKFMHGGGHSYANMIATHADELNLSDAQLGRFIRLHQKNSQEHKQFKKKIHQGMKSLHHAGMKPSTDDATLRKLGNEHVEAFNAMLEQHIKNRNVVNAILTAEQREQLKTMKMNHGKHGGHHGGHKEKHSSKYY
jgi:Spy/CpxP family protein refolding chaperone